MSVQTHFIPSRVFIGVQFFFACVIAYMLRVNLSVNIVAMVYQEPKPITETSCTLINSTQELNRNFGVRYKWDNQIQGFILGAYFWGYIPSCLIGGYLAQTFSPTKIIAISTLLSAMLSALCPLTASYHYMALIAIRLLLGAAGGVVYPCLHSMLAKWVPPAEKGRFITALMGGTFGTVITWSCIGHIIEIWGWVWAFYIPAIVASIWAIGWWCSVSDSPSEHTRISSDEREYILKCIGDNVSTVKLKAPYSKIIKSIPYWALVILHMGNLWGLYFILTVGPKFLSEILGFDLKNSGMLSGVPYMARLFAGFMFGYFSDILRQKEIVSLTFIRKFFCLFSHIIPGMLLLCLLIVGCDHNWAVVLLTLSQGFNGASTVTSLQNAQDLAPNFAGTLYGTMNSIGSITGILTPMITGQITKNNNEMSSWHICFIIGASIYFICTIVYLIFGTANEQEWNREEKHEENVNNKLEGHDNQAYA